MLNAQKREKHQQPSLDEDELYCKKVLELTKNRLKGTQLPSKEPQCLVQFVEDWIGKLKHEGYFVQKVLEVFKGKSNSYLDRIWLQKFLTSYRRSVGKRNLEPRICLPRMLIEKDENEIRAMLQQEYPHLSMDTGLLNYVMRGNKWKNLNWSEIIEQLGRNRYEVQKIASDLGEGEAMGVIFRSAAMKELQMRYGDCVYMLQYSSAVETKKEDEHSEKLEYLIVGMVLTEFRLPAVVFYALYETTPGQVGPLLWGSGQGQRSSTPSVPAQTQGLISQANMSQITTLFVGNYIYEWVDQHPHHILCFTLAPSTVLPNVHATQVVINKLEHNRPGIMSSVHIPRQPAAETKAEDKIKSLRAFMGPYASSSDPFVEIWQYLNSCLTHNNQYSFSKLLLMQDRCQLITLLIKIGLALEYESIAKRQAGNLALVDTTLFDQSDQVHRFMLQQIRRVRSILCSRSIALTIMQTIQQIVKYEISTASCNSDNRASLCAHDLTHSQTRESAIVHYNLEHSYWECSCNYIYRTGLPCVHLVKVLQHYKGDVSYYVSDRWKSNPYLIQSQPNNTHNSENRRLSTSNTGLLKLLNVYRDAML